MHWQVRTRITTSLAVTTTQGEREANNLIASYTLTKVTTNKHKDSEIGALEQCVTQQQEFEKNSI